MSPEIKGVIIGSLISSGVLLISAVIQFLSAWRQRKADEKMRYRDALFRLAFDSWHAELQTTKRLEPIEDHLIRMDTLHTLFIEENPSPQKVEAKLNAFMLLKEQWAKRFPAP